MRKRIKTHIVVFRLEEQQWNQLAETAEASGQNPNDWCRNLTLAEIDSGLGLSRNERLIFEEVSRIRYLLGQGFYLLASDELNLQGWDEVRRKSQEKVSEITRHLLSSSKTASR
jgi:hypothetical protein